MDSRKRSWKGGIEVRCLVLGGCGFIGSHLVDALIDQGYQVVIFDKVNVDTKNIYHVINKIELITGDFANQDDLKNVIRNIDYIFHFIGTTLPQSSTENPIYDIASNVIPTIQLLEIARSASVKKIIFASSGGTIYGIPKIIPITEDHPADPVCAYGISKLMNEKYLHLYSRLYGLDYVALRFANAYGSRQNPHGSQGAIAVFLGNISKGNPIHIWGDGTVVRDYIYVKDVVYACLKAIETKQKEYHIFNIGSGIGTSLNQLIEIFRKQVKKNIQVRYTPGRKIDVPINILDINLAKDILKWEPTVSFEEGLELTLKEFKERWDY